MHTVRVRLVVRPHQARGIDQRLFALGQLRNATMRETRAHAEAMVADPRWREHARIVDGKKRAAAYSALRFEYAVGEKFTRELACAHWNASGWMRDLLDRRAANALGGEVWQSVESWLYAGFGRPRTSHPAGRDMAWGNDLNGGLTLKDAQKLADWRLVWSTQAINRSRGRLGRKKLSLALDWSCQNASRRAYIQANLGALRRVGIRRKMVRGEARYWAHLCLDCAPYRSDDYLRRLNERPADEVLGLDMGPTEQAWVRESSSGVIRLGQQAISRAEEMAARERRIQRALDRSRRASNPDCYGDNGRVISGTRPRKLSSRGRRFAAEYAEAKRKSAAQRRAATIAQAQDVSLLAPVVRVEDSGLRAWQRTYGKRMMLTHPGLFLARLGHEQRLTDGRVERLPLRSAFSQHCVCGTKVKKPRSQDWHECQNPECALHGIRLNRHLFSAWLMRITASRQLGGVPALHEGTLATSLTQQYGGAPVLQESLRQLCGYRERGRVKHSEGGQVKRKRGLTGSAAGRIAQEAKPTYALPVGERFTAFARADVRGNAALLETKKLGSSPWESST